MKEKELHELRQYLASLKGVTLPSYAELPSIPLYMEQVVAYVNKTLEPLSMEDRQLLTSFMVNNYVKAKIIAEPDKKKYNVNHLGYLLAISSLKSVLSMSDIALLIGMDDDVSSDKSVLYKFFKNMTEDVYHDLGSRTYRRIESFYETYQKNQEKDAEKADRYFRDSFGLIAMRMAIQSAVYQQMAHVLLQYLAKDMIGAAFDEKAFQPGTHELRHEMRQAKHAAERVAQIHEDAENEKKAVEAEKQKEAAKKKVAASKSKKKEGKSK
ncbi:MAG: DUF1836 domain-containing protein [Erysipelotrichaceae bacterium]|nr:DUF1836 domain-containing protein [Erysipelotrichaceae bacterium]